ncbi:MAG: efflux RND transporter permease subunit [Proteobacteria bacterium]|nr:efflux RND transporter permease subunit [Pseudomonadota bacterium]NOG61692.1 efflux RND transporter permease subunit [Pseudomonadota bacterium]
MFRFAINNPIIVTVTILIICLFGILSLFRVPVQMIPDLDPRVISIQTRWAGATPQDIEKEIVIEQEEYLRRIPGLERMTSTARTGSAEIELEFPHGIDINEALLKVNNAITQVPGYPENVDEPRITSSSFSSNSFMYFSIKPLAGNPKNHKIVEMRDFLEDNVQTFLERVPGIDSVRLRGGEEPQIRIYVDPIKLAERDIRLIDVRNAIRARNRDVSGGDLDAGKRRYLLRTRGRFDNLQEMENMVIARQGDVFVRLKDVGYIEQSISEIRSIAYGNGEPVVNLAVNRQLGSNVIQIKKDILKVTDELNQGFLKDNGLQIQLISEDVRYVEQSVKVVSQNLLIGAVLATFILFLFLRSSSATLVGAIGIPVCTVTAFLGLLITGRTMNVISMAGVAFAIGMTLDNSIVVLENIYKHISQGKTRMQAAYEGVKEVWSAVLASTLTTVFVFLPIIFIKEEAGQLYSDIAVAISASILMSMIIATTVIPVACSRFLAPNTSRPSKFGVYRMGQKFGHVVMWFVDWLLHGVIRRLVLIGGVLLITVLILQYLTPKAEYLPEGEEKKIFASVFAPPGYNIEQMHAISKDVNEHFIPHLDKKPEDYLGREDEIPPLDYIFVFNDSERTRFVVEVTSRKHFDKLIELTQDYVQKFPGVITFVSRGSIFSGNSGGTRSINVDISGPDLEELYEVGLETFIHSKQIFDNPRVKPDPSTLTLGQPMIEIRPDWERAAELGIGADELGYTIWAYSDGAFVDEYFQDDKKIDMFLYSTHGAIQNPGDINNLMLYSRQGGILPLSAVATVNETVNTETIRRVDGRRTITLSIIPPRKVPLEEGVDTVKRDLIQYMKDTGRMYDGMTMSISGASDRLNATRQALQGNFITAVLIAYLLMVAIFSHWGYPFLIMTSVPVGISGGIVGLWLVNFFGGKLDKIGLQNISQPFDMITMLGFLILIGTVVNNPILLVERTMANIRVRSMDFIEAIRESTESRIRPIMMSMITTIVGLSPLVFNPGQGTELYRGLGAIVLFGLLFSTIITLTFMPCLLSLVLELREKFSGNKENKKVESVSIQVK